jgi:hypothetical protein
MLVNSILISMQNNTNKRSANHMDVYGDLAHVNNIIVCVEANKVVTLIKQANRYPKTVLKYTIAKVDQEKVDIYSETIMYVIAGRDETDKLISMSWNSVNTLKSFISQLVPAEWIVYIK